MEITEYELSVIESFSEGTLPFPERGNDHFHNKVVTQVNLNIKAIELQDELGRISEDSHQPSLEEIESLKERMGDVLWHITALSLMYGFSLEDVVESNSSKLRGNNE